MNDEYLLTIKVQNNYLIEMMRLNNIKNVAELSRLSGIGPSDLGRVLALKTSLYTSKGLLSKIISRLSIFFRCLPEDLCPKDQHNKGLEKNTSSATFTAENMALFQDNQNVMPIDEFLIKSEEDGDDKIIFNLLKGLNEREKRVIKYRYGLDRDKPLTRSSIAEKEDISQQRIRQIELKSLIKMKMHSAPNHGE